MTPTVFAVLCVAALVAAFVQGTIGVGFALIVAPVMGFLAPEQIPAVVLILMLPLNVWVAWRERASIDMRAAGWITAGRVAGTFGGLWILTALPLTMLNVLIGAATVLAAGATLLAPAFRAGPRSFVTAGAVTGVTETATGIGGPPLALVFQHHPAAVLRSTIAVCFLVGQVVSLVFLALAGRAAMEQWRDAALLLPAVVVGLLFSQLSHHRVTSRALRTFVMAFAIVSGTVLMFR